MRIRHGLLLIACIFLTVSAWAEDVDINTRYPSSIGRYKKLEINDASHAAYTRFTTETQNNGIKLFNKYGLYSLYNSVPLSKTSALSYEAEGQFTGGLFWLARDELYPRLGIWAYNGVWCKRSFQNNANDPNTPYLWGSDTLGSSLLFGTSNSQSLNPQINQPLMTLSPRGYLGIGTMDNMVAMSPTVEPQSRLWVRSGYISVQSDELWSSAKWPVSYSSGVSDALTIAGPVATDGGNISNGEGYLGFGINSDFGSVGSEGSRGGGWYFFRTADHFGEIKKDPEYIVVFKGGAPANSIYLSEEGNLHIGGVGVDPPDVLVSPTVYSFAKTDVFNLDVYDIYLRGKSVWLSQVLGVTGGPTAHAAKLVKTTGTSVTGSAKVNFNSVVFNYGGIAQGTNIVIKRKNIYQINGSCSASTLTAPGFLRVLIYINGFERSRSQVNISTSNQPVVAQISDTLVLDAGDRVEMYVTHSDASSKQLGFVGADLQPKLSVCEVAHD